MPYLILALGILIGLYALYKFFLNANVHQVKAFLLMAITVILGLALFFLAVTGRLIAALTLLVALLPLALNYWRAKRGHNGDIIDVTPIEDDKSEDDKPS